MSCIDLIGDHLIFCSDSIHHVVDYNNEQIIFSLSATFENNFFSMVVDVVRTGDKDVKRANLLIY
jgi:hypothetical protein